MKQNRKGFSLVELIVVLVIMAIIAALCAPNISAYVQAAKIQNLSDCGEQSGGRTPDPAAPEPVLELGRGKAECRGDSALRCRKRRDAFEQQ